MENTTPNQVAIDALKKYLDAEAEISRLDIQRTQLDETIKGLKEQRDKVESTYVSLKPAQVAVYYFPDYPPMLITIKDPYLHTKPIKSFTVTQ
ncbi:MAG: hypothetical protein JWP57_2050 [Spirosoma sp.]|nr:hypothetical protein [Spirosoma sp.]